MEIKSIKDIKLVRGEMHDSEFGEEDFGFDPESKVFHLKSHSPDVLGRVLYLELPRVKKIDSNLGKIKTRYRPVFGVFNTIKIKKKGLELVLLSQDLRIVLYLEALAGKFEMIDDKKTNIQARVKRRGVTTWKWPSSHPWWWPKKNDK